MDRELAQIIMHTAGRAGREIADLAFLVKEHCEGETYEKFKMAIARVVAEIHLELKEPIFEMHPDLKEELEARYEKYGRAYY